MVSQWKERATILLVLITTSIKQFSAQKRDVVPLHSTAQKQVNNFSFPID